MPGGVVEIGHDGDGFCFDNETPRHRVLLQPHALASRAVTNGEYLEFIRAGGYTEPSLWLSDGWAKVNAEGWNAPALLERGPERALHARRPARYRSRARRCVTSATTRRTPSHAGRTRACRRRRSWSMRRPRSRSPETSSRADFSNPSPPRGIGPDAALRRRLGVDEQRLRPLPRLPAAARARSASTTASSCAASSCCGAAPVLRRPRTCVRPTGTSSIRMRAGNTPASAWPGISEAHS